MVKYVIFDLDGTLIDTAPDLGRTCDYLLQSAGITPKWSIEDYRGFVGNGAKKLIERAFSGTLSKEEIDEKYPVFEEKYLELMLDNAYPYPGVKEALRALKEHGLKLAVSTNKPAPAAVKMIETVFGRGTFEFTLGVENNAPTKPDVTALKARLSEESVEGKNCLWAGDSNVDMKSAENLGCPFIAVTWGFTPIYALRELNPAYVANTAEEMQNIILSLI